MAQQIFQGDPREPEPRAARLDVSNGIGESRSVWLSAGEAAIYNGNRSANAFRMWAQRHGITPNGRSQYLRRDIDKARALPRKRRAMAAASLANLRRRHVQQPSDTAQVVTTAKTSEEG